jgi:hypothetical protein
LISVSYWEDLYRESTFTHPDVLPDRRSFQGTRPIRQQEQHARIQVESVPASLSELLPLSPVFAADE